LNAFFDAAGLDLAPLQVPGSAATGEGRGILYQRPGHPDLSAPELFEGPPRRRYDPRTIPLGMAQAIGHIRDDKSRKLLGPWSEGQAAGDGPLRALVTDGRTARYGASIPEDPIGAGEGRILFLDGGMNHAPAERYELLDVAVRRKLVPAL
jgi:hypothetical protein